MKVTLLLIFIILSMPFQAQNLKIKGIVVDNNNDLLPNATIQIKNKLKGTTSDIYGKYELNCNPSDTLIIRYIGYITKEVKVDGKDKIDIMLEIDESMLPEIEIVGKRNGIELKSDKFIVDLEYFNIKGKETSDVLKQLPTIIVADESLNIIGRDEVIVYLNNRIVNLRGQNLLDYINTLDLNIIDNIEVIPNPSTEYDAGGNVGIINIETKKNTADVWNGNMRGGFIVNSYFSEMLSGMLSYNGRKFYFDVTFFNSINNYLNQVNYISYFTDEMIMSYNPRKYNSLSFETMISLGYNINEKANLGIDIQIPFYNKENVTDIENQAAFYNNVSNNLDSIIDSKGLTETTNYLYNVETYVNHSFNDDVKINFNMAYIKNNIANYREWSSDYYINSILYHNEDYFTDGNLTYDILTSKIDLSFPLFGLSTKIGYKLSHTNSLSNNGLFLKYDSQNIIDNFASNEFDCREMINAFYMDISKGINNFSFKLGLRAESTLTITEQVNINQKNKNIYFDLFPSAHSSYNINENNRISLSYSKRIERPIFKYMNPFRWYINKYDYALGNPYLSPSYINNMDFSYSYKQIFNVRIYYRHVKDKMGMMVTLNPENMMNQVQVSGNFFDEQTMGLGIHYYNRFWRIWEVVLMSNFELVDFISKNNAFTNSSGYSCNFSMLNNIQISKRCILVFNIVEEIPGLYNYRYVDNSFKMDIGLTITCDKEPLDIRLMFNDVFNSSSPDYYYYSNGIKQHYSNYYDTRSFKLIVSWKFGDKKNNNNHEISNQEEKDRL